MPDAIPTPKVFVSYSHTDDEHKAWVVSLAERLTSDGVHVVADFWDLNEGHDLNAFMERMVTDTTMSKVLVICDARYKKKADGRTGGVGTEAQIISKEVYTKVSQEKFIPIVRERDDDDKACLPVYFGSHLYIDFSEEDHFADAYEQLIRNLFGRPVLKRPPLGKPPSDLFVENHQQVKPAGKLLRLREAVERGKPHLDVLAGEYLELFADSLEDFRIDGNNAVAEKPFDDLVVESIERFRPYRDNFIDFAVLFADYLDTTAIHDRVHGFLERLLAYRYRPEHVTSWRETDYDNFRFLVYELFISMLAVLVAKKKYATLSRFIHATYFTKPGHGELQSKSYSDFRAFISTLEETRKNRLKINKYSVTTFLLKEYATHPQVTFANLLQVDVLLFLRSCTSDVDLYFWFPSLAVYARGSGALELFARAVSPTGMEPFKQIFGTPTLRDLLTKLDAIFQTDRWQRCRSQEMFWDVNWEALLNLKLLRVAAGR